MGVLSPLQSSRFFHFLQGRELILLGPGHLVTGEGQVVIQALQKSHQIFQPLRIIAAPQLIVVSALPVSYSQGPLLGNEEKDLVPGMGRILGHEAAGNAPRSMVRGPSISIWAVVTRMVSGSAYSRRIHSTQAGISSPVESRSSMDASSHFQLSRRRRVSFVSRVARVRPFTARRPKLWSQCQWVRTVMSGVGCPAAFSAA